MPPSSVPDDQQLVQAILAGEEDAFRQLYYRYADPLFGFLWRKTRNKEVAQDLVQECFVRIWRARTRLDPKQSLKAFCYQIANNLAIDHLRKKTSGLEEVDADVNHHAPTTQIDESGFQTRAQVQKAVSQLPEAQRQVLCLSRFEGLKYAEIADVLNISVKTVETHMSRALKKLRQSLAGLITQIVIFINFL